MFISLIIESFIIRMNNEV
jgi:hypothetical protein